MNTPKVRAPRLHGRMPVSARRAIGEDTPLKLSPATSVWSRLLIGGSGAAGVVTAGFLVYALAVTPW